MSSPFNTRISMLKARGAQMAGGGMRADGKQPNTKVNWDMPGEVIPMYQGFASEGVKALGEQSAFDFRKELGSYLGGLNSTGALRSGAVESGANDIMDTYSRNFASAASQATLGAIGYGQQRVGQALSDEAAAADRKNQRKIGTIGAIGGLLGAGAGMFNFGAAGAK